MGPDEILRLSSKIDTWKDRNRAELNMVSEHLAGDISDDNVRREHARLLPRNDPEGGTCYSASGHERPATRTVSRRARIKRLRASNVSVAMTRVYSSGVLIK